MKATLLLSLLLFTLSPLSAWSMEPFDCRTVLTTVAPEEDDAALKGFFDRSLESMQDRDWEKVEGDLRRLWGRDRLRKMGPVGDDVIQGALMELLSGWEKHRSQVEQGRSVSTLLRTLLSRAAYQNRQEVGDLMPAWAREAESGNDAGFVRDYRASHLPTAQWSEWFQELPAHQRKFVEAFGEGHATPQAIATKLGLSNWKEAVGLADELKSHLSPPGANTVRTIPVTEVEAKQFTNYVKNRAGQLDQWFYDQVRLAFGIAELGVRDLQLTADSDGALVVTLPRGPYSFSDHQIRFQATEKAVRTMDLTELHHDIGKGNFTPAMRVAMNYRYWKRWSVKEIAQRLDMPWRDVTALLYRASRMLAEEWGVPEVNFATLRVSAHAAGNPALLTRSLEAAADEIAHRPARVGYAAPPEAQRTVTVSPYQMQVVWDWKIQAGSLAQEAVRQNKKGEALRTTYFTGVMPKLAQLFGKDRLAAEDIAFVTDPNDPSYPLAMVRHEGQWVPIRVRGKAAPLKSDRVDYLLAPASFYRLVYTLPRPYRAVALLMFEDGLSDSQIMARLSVAPNVIEQVRQQVSSRLRRHLNDSQVHAGNFRVTADKPGEAQRAVDWPSGRVPLRVSREDLNRALEMLLPSEQDYVRRALEGWSFSEIAEARNVTENSARNITSFAMRKLAEILGWTEQTDLISARDILVLDSPAGTGRKRSGELRPHEALAGNSLPQQIRHYLRQRKAGGDARVSMTGLARMAQDLGVTDMRTMYHAAVVALGEQTAIDRRWAAFPGTPELALRVRRALQSRSNASRFTGRDGFQRFADRYFGGDTPLAWDGAVAIMGKRFEQELGWGERPTPSKEAPLRLAEVESRSPEALQDSAGQFRAAFELAEASLADVYRAGQRQKLQPAVRNWKPFDGSPGESLLFTDSLWASPGRAIEGFKGASGARRFANQYLGGKVQRALELSRQILSPAEQAELGWTNRGQVPDEVAPGYVGKRILSSERLPTVELTAPQRAAVAEYLHGFVKHGRPPSQNEIGATAMNRLADQFGGLPNAQLAIKAYAQEFDLPVRVVEAVIETPPSEALKKVWQSEAVDLYLEWVLRHDGRLPSQPEWGRRQADGDRVGVDQARMFGADNYAVGKPQTEYRIFSSQQEALLAVSARAEELNIPFSLLQQKFRSHETPPELRAAWQREARRLLDSWKARNPGRYPVATDFGAGVGQVGMTYKRFFLQARNSKEWIFEQREQADRMMAEVFGTR